MTSRRDWRHYQALMLLVVLLVTWQLVTVVGGYSSILLPSPVGVVEEFVGEAASGEMLDAMRLTLVPLVQALVVSGILGAVLGLLFGSFRVLGIVTRPYLWAGFALPRVALLPLFLLWLGVGQSLKFWMVVASATIPLVLSVMDGMGTVDASLVKCAKSFLANKWQLVTKVVVPSTVPFIANGMRLAISRGFVAIIVSEMVVSTGGVGTEAIEATMGNINTAKMLAYTVVMILFGVLLVQVSRKLEGFASRWRVASGV